jgi:hypothetical protein
MLAVIFLHVQKSKTNFQSHYFLAMSLSRRQRCCPQCTFWFSSLSRHYQYSPRCNLTRSLSPCFSSDDDGDDMMANAIPDDLSFQPQAGFISAPPSSQSQEPSPPHGLLEDEEYESFLSDGNCPPPYQLRSPLHSSSWPTCEQLPSRRKPASKCLGHSPIRY